jgi:serine/threonine protein kinase
MYDTGHRARRQHAPTDFTDASTKRNQCANPGYDATTRVSVETDDPSDQHPQLSAAESAGSADTYADVTTPSPGHALAAAATAMHALAEDRADPWLGRVLDDRYRITERLGEGGMGAVFVAEHLKLRKQVALKVIRAELAGNGEVAARFAREAMATAQFEHPHVASAIDFGTLEEGGAYLVMQLVRGRSLRDLLDQGGKLPWPIACELLAQVADALSAARLAGIVHRDLKPENILVEVREDGSYLAKILDFGIAHVAPHHATPLPGENDRHALTRIGTVMGTPGYMSPEQAVGDRVDHRTDLYALGVVLWECVTGRALWDGPDVTSIITKQLQQPVPRLREVLSDARMPRALDELVQRLCARKLDDRPEHAGLVRDELRALARHTATPLVVLRDSASHGTTLLRARFLALPASSRTLLVAGSLTALLALLALGAGKRANPNTLTAPPATPVHVPVAVTPAAAPSLAERAMRFVVGAQTGKQEPETGIPDELREDAKTVLESSRSQDRRRAAGNILQYKPATRVWPHLLAVARLEQARSCRERKDAITDIVELKDPRALPALRRLADSGRTGCGFLGLRDCYGCIRPDLRRALDALDSQQP